jgi:amino acid transporter
MNGLPAERGHVAVRQHVQQHGARRTGISTRIGVAICSGVPVLILLSMGPVAGLAGPPSVLVWGLSAVIGLCMGLAFTELAASRPYLTGGIGVLAASVYAPRSRVLALVSPWSYWFGWSPALAINGILVGTYLHGMVLPRAPSWTIVALATCVLGGSVTVNHFGLRAGGRFQVILIICVMCGIALLAAGTVLSGRFDTERLVPFTPPGGWLSGHGIIAIGGGLFIAGWSAYGAELALSYSGEYRDGTREAIRALVIIAIVGVIAFTIAPLILIGVVGTRRAQADPSAALLPLARIVAGAAGDVVIVILIVALVLSLNMITIGSSRALYRMARNGRAPASLGRLNRYGVPGNALVFDLAVNVTLLLAVTLLHRGHTASIPIALLAASNVGYFISISLALIAAWLNRRREQTGHQQLKIRAGLMNFALGLAALNFALIVFGGFAWGWTNLALGIVVLTGVIALFARRRSPVPAQSLPGPLAGAGREG